MNTQEVVVNTDNEMRKRVCLSCDLKNDPKLIAEYRQYHSPEHHWKEIANGIKSAGFEVMDIYLVDNRMFMICEVAEVLDFDKVWSDTGSYPKQGEWAELMTKFQQAIPGHPLEWVKMDRIFTIK